MPPEAIPIYVGYDPREAVAYHVFCQSVIEKSSVPVAFFPLYNGLIDNFDGQQDGTNAFIYSRYLVPELMHYNGWALFFDGDMVCNVDIAELWALRDVHIGKAVAVVKHDYKTREHRKYVGTSLESDNIDYPRKNWSSVVLWNCGHFANQALTRDSVATLGGEYLHRFGWLDDGLIAELPHDWNSLVREDPPGCAYLNHFTLGVPGIKHYANDPASWRWHSALLGALRCAGENPVQMVKRAEGAIGEL